MWTQQYYPVAGSLLLSSIAAALPLIVLGLSLGVFRLASWKSCLVATAVGLGVAVLVYDMPVRLALAAGAYGAVFGLFPLGYLVYAAILLFDLVVASGRLNNIRRSLADMNPDVRLQALIVAFAFGAFLEGATGAGTPVAISASILTGVGLTPLMAGAMSLLANTAPVAFGALGLPILTLASVTGLPVQSLSAAAGRICPVVALFVPAYLIVVLAGGAGAWGIWPALLVSGFTFAAAQYLVSNFVGPYLPDIISAIATMAALILLLRVWKPRVEMRTVAEPDVPPPSAWNGVAVTVSVRPPRITTREVFTAWSPYLILVVTVVTWGIGPTQQLLDRATVHIAVPLLHDAVLLTAPLVPTPRPYPAIFLFNWLGAAGTACLIAALLTAAVSGMRPAQVIAIGSGTARRLALPELTIASVLGLAFIMNYSGATATLGLAAASTGALLPFFGAYLGWLGVFLSGSDTSANALFGQLQTVSARNVHLNPVLMAAVNTCGGVMGKMISIQSIAVAAAATGMPASDEGRLFRLMLKHSVLLAGVIGLIACVYAYLLPAWIPTAE